MPTRHLDDLDRSYRRSMYFALPLSILAFLALLLLVPAERIVEPENRDLALSGTLQILPELDIIPPEVDDSRLTAAPRHARPTDFVAVDIEYTIDPLSPDPVPVPEPLEVEEENLKEVFLTWDDLATEVRTTGHPVLAQTEFQILHLERPTYPAHAVDLGIEGVVDVMLMVSRHGKVQQAYVVTPGRHPMLEDAALIALHKSLFKPYMREGKAIPFWVRIPVQFRLVS